MAYIPDEQIRFNVRKLLSSLHERLYAYRKVLLEPEESEAVFSNMKNRTSGECIRGLSLFSGIGGLDLAFEAAGGVVAAMCEIEPYCRQVLCKHWPDVPLFEDVKELKGTDVGAVDVIYGGFPCQPFSVAGNKRGKDDSRYLWPEFSRLVSEIRPRWIVAENVPGILRIAADDVCRDLERQGYSVGIWDFEAASVGAPHRRERIFFVAHTGRTLRQGSIEQETLQDEGGEGYAYKPERPGCAFAPDSDSERCEEQRESLKGQAAHVIVGCGGRWESEPCMGGMVDGISAGLDGDGLTFWRTEPEPKERTAYGIPDRTNRLKALGNAVVPQQAYPVFNAIMETEMRRHK